MSFENSPLVSEIRERFYYENGSIRVKKVGQWKGKVNEIAGTVHPDNRIVIQVRNKRFFAHQIVWLLHYDKLPSTSIDHIDRDPTNNRINNLRAATNSEQQGNTGINRNNTSGFKGVSLKKGVIKKPWLSSIKSMGKRISLGYFRTPEEAAEAYDIAALKKFGEFAAINFPERRSFYVI